MKPLESSSSGPNEREGGREGGRESERVRECQNENRERTGEAYVQTTNASCYVLLHLLPLLGRGCCFYILVYSSAVIKPLPQKQCHV